MDGNKTSANNITKRSALVLYHYFFPDDVVSARHYEDLCVELAARGWYVEVQPCNRGCRDETKTYPKRSEHKGVHIRRIWRPRFKQSSFSGRLLNASWMILAWSRVVFVQRSKFPDVVVVGTDPIFGVLTASIINFFRPRSVIAHWCFDMHPDASVANDTISNNSRTIRIIKYFMKASYNACSLMTDIGSCMRKKLNEYMHTCNNQRTIVPWSLYEPLKVEPVDEKIRHEIFGDAILGILYSGNFGRAHTCNEFIALAEHLENDSVSFCFAARGNCEDTLNEALENSSVPIKKSGFVPEEDLNKHLGSADIHLVSLKPSWTGIVVPSKFFGSLAVGRPVIFAGSENSAIARWICEYQVGWVLSRDNISQVGEELKKLIESPALLDDMKERCHKVYQKHFSKNISMDRWDHELRQIL